MNIEIRPFQEEDAAAVAAVIRQTLLISNSRDYPPEEIQVQIESHSQQVMLERSRWSHMYVACDGETVVGCGAVAPYWGSLEESILLSIFILPEYQGMGIGRRIVLTLEEDEFFRRARRVEIPASITGVNFYRKLGYTFKNGDDRLTEEMNYRLEKFPQKNAGAYEAYS